jgi:polyphosphate kinase
MNRKLFYNKDISWLAFNGRVLEEAASETVPLFERLHFLSIFSSNLDEFYRVKMPAKLALEKIGGKNTADLKQINAIVHKQQKRFGFILDDMIIPLLKEAGIHFFNEEPIPDELKNQVSEIFFNEVAGLLRPVYFENVTSFFAENNELYVLVILKEPNGIEKLAIVNIPTKTLPRLYLLHEGGKRFVVFIDDIIKSNIDILFPGKKVKSTFNIKITRDAELNLSEDYEEDIAAKIEKQLKKRDYGLAIRFLYQPGIPQKHWKEIFEKFNLLKSNLVPGGVHHGLKDLRSFPVKDGEYLYPVGMPLSLQISQDTLFKKITHQDVMVHTPYHHYNTVLRFFNEAALDPAVLEINTTLYRIAADSRIAHALINAAQNGKKVTVIIELKARFDEANNLKWSKRMKDAGVKILYSSNNIKVHAKIALVVRNHATHPYLGLLATGNLNESTAKVYTDHILLTAHVDMLNELKMLFDFLVKKQKPEKADHIIFNHLLVSQFNLHQKFLDLIDREIANAGKGLPAGITIKLNNLEEGKLIKKLYKASAAGVKVDLMVRGICCLIPGAQGLSENISVKRVVDRYLEHGRVFKFINGGKVEIFMGSADWMKRNIYRRIEVCFPIYQDTLKTELNDILALQWGDNVKAVWIDANGENQPVSLSENPIRSQVEIYQYLKAN